MDSEQGSSCLWNRLPVELVACKLEFPRLPNLAVRVLCWDFLLQASRLPPSIVYIYIYSIEKALDLSSKSVYTHRHMLSKGGPFCKVCIKHTYNQISPVQYQLLQMQFISCRIRAAQWAACRFYYIYTCSMCPGTNRPGSK